MNFHVADWYVDVAANRIRKGHQDVKLESKVMTLLVYLAQHQGEVVSREQLEADVWVDRVISYDALTSCITRLRKVLGDDSRQPAYIETVPKKGYRMIAPVQWMETEPSAGTAALPRHSNRLKPIAISIVLALTVILVITAITLFTPPLDTGKNIGDTGDAIRQPEQ